jgi:hypothetical protein
MYKREKRRGGGKTSITVNQAKHATPTVLPPPDTLEDMVVVYFDHRNTSYAPLVWWGMIMH